MRAVVQTENAPTPVGPYSQAIRANGFLFISGQIPIEPQTQKLVTGGISQQTERVMENVMALLRESRLGPENVVRCVVYLTSMDDFAAMNSVYGRYFATTLPARTTVEVTRLPKQSLIEIEVTAALPV